MAPSLNPSKKNKSTSRTKITCVAGNIVTIGTDVIVNAANSGLRQGAGVCGAIFKAAGSTGEARAVFQSIGSL